MSADTRVFDLTNRHMGMMDNTPGFSMEDRDPNNINLHLQVSGDWVQTCFLYLDVEAKFTNECKNVLSSNKPCWHVLTLCNQNVIRPMSVILLDYLHTAAPYISANKIKSQKTFKQAELLSKARNVVFRGVCACGCELQLWCYIQPQILQSITVTLEPEPLSVFKCLVMPTSKLLQHRPNVWIQFLIASLADTHFTSCLATRQRRLSFQIVTGFNPYRRPKCGRVDTVFT